MKKIYTFMMLMTVAILTFTAAAKSFTIRIDDPTRAYLINTQNGMPYEWDGNILTFTNADDNMFIPTNAAQGYVITGVTDLNTGTCPASGQFPSDFCQIYSANISDGATVQITTAEKEIPVLTITADDPSILSVRYNYTSYSLENGCFTVPLTVQYSSVEISSLNTDYAVTGATDDQGNTYTAYSGTVSIYAGSISKSRVITVQTQNLAEGRTATMTVNITGNESAVQLMNTSNYQTVPLNGASTVVKFNPNTESSFMVQSAIYNKNLYKVELNGERLTASGSSYYFTATDGCTLNIDTEFPDINVPMSFAYGEGVGSDIVKSVSIDGLNIYNWGAEDFSVKLGERVHIVFNNTTYTNITATHNGRPISLSPYSPYYEFVASSEDPIEIYVNGTKPQPYHITVITDCPEGVKVYNGYGYNESELIELTGEETEFDIPSSYSYLTFKDAPGHVVESVMDESGNTLYAGSSNYIQGDMTIFVVASKVERNNTATVYVEPGSWAYRTITLSQGNQDLCVQYIDSSLPTGYSFIPFGSFDLPFMVSGYPSLVLYVNGEQKEPLYGALNEELEDGCVLKMFRTTPESYNVSYDIDEEVAVEVRHDHTTLIDSPSAHSVFAGTEIVITPVAAESPVARVSAEQEGLPVVKVDGETCQPDEDGKYVIAINKDTDIRVERGDTVGINSIDAGEISGESPVYNLQGILVGKASMLKELPAGTYITGGLKIRK